MKKQFFLLTGLLLAAVAVQAQKIKQERVNVQYTQLPATPLDASFTTYTLRIRGAQYYLDNIRKTQSSLESHFQLDGFKKIPNGGHFTIEVNLGYFRVDSDKMETSTSKEKQKDGTEKVITKYYKSIRWSMPISWRLYDYEGRVLFDTYHTDRNSSQTYTTSRYNTPGEASRYWSDNYNRITNNLIESHINSNLGEMGRQFRHSYDFQRIVKATDELEVLREKDEGYEDFNRAYETVKAAFAQMTPDQPVDRLREAVKPAVEFWLKAKDQFDPADKKQKGLIHACLFNVASVFYWLDDLDSAERYANQANNLDWKEGRSKRLLKEIEATRKLFVANKVTTRHIFRDPEKAIPPAKAIELAEKAEEEAANSAVFNGYMNTLTGDSLTGKFTIKIAEGTELKFGPSGNVVFQHQKAGKDVTDVLKPGDVKSFAFNDRKFFVKSFAPGAKGNTQAGMHILEQLYTSDKITVYQYHPYDNKLGDVETEYAYQKRGEIAPVSISGSAFLLFKKGLAKYFSDCADLAELANNDEFKKTEADIIRAARVYAELCAIKP